VHLVSASVIFTYEWQCIRLHLHYFPTGDRAVLLLPDHP